MSQLITLATLSLFHMAFSHEPEILPPGLPCPNPYDGYTMVPILDGRTGSVSSVGSPDPAYDITFSAPFGVYTANDEWSWSRAYRGHVYGTRALSRTITFPPNTCAFIFYLDPNVFGTLSFAVTYSNGEVVETDVYWETEQGLAVSYDDAMGIPLSVTVSVPSNGFGIGEISMAICPDADGDGIPDPLDICPCGDDTVDEDRDGIPDDCDECPSNPSPDCADECVSSCEGLENGDYQSCNGCDVYVTCSNGYTYDYRPCPPASPPMQWDDDLKRCETTSGTCTP